MTAEGMTKKEEIVIIGASILDVVVWPADRGVFDTGSFPAEEVRMSFGGDALNEATVLASFGKRVLLETIVGADMAGDLIREHCRKKQIKLGKSFLKKDLQTGMNVVLVQESGERNFLTGKNGTLRKLKIQDITRPFPEEAGILSFASIFVFPEIQGAELSEIFREAKAQGMTVCADMTKRKNGETVKEIADALRFVDYLFPNEEEARLVTEARDGEEAAKILWEAGVKHVIIKCGKRGCYIFSEEYQGYVPAEKNVTCVDTTGAGDSFTAGFLYGLSEGWDLLHCARFANRCGAKAVETTGAVVWCENRNVREEVDFL